MKEIMITYQMWQMRNLDLMIVGLISKFIEVMPAKDSRLIRDVYRKIIPNVDLTQEITCPNCAVESRMEVPFGADFFFPR